MCRNGRTASPESVDASLRNGWTPCSGIRGRIGPEYATLSLGSASGASVGVRSSAKAASLHAPAPAHVGRLRHRVCHREAEGGVRLVRLPTGILVMARGKSGASTTAGTRPRRACGHIPPAVVVTPFPTVVGGLRHNSGTLGTGGRRCRSALPPPAMLAVAHPRATAATPGEAVGDRRVTPSCSVLSPGRAFDALRAGAG